MTSWLLRLRLPEKILLSSLLLVVPLGIQWFLSLKESNEYMAFTAREREGVSLIHGLTDLAAQLSRYSSPSERTRAAAGIEQQIAHVPPAEREAISKEWAKVKGSSSEQSDLRMDEMEAFVQERIDEVGNEYSLGLDGQPDTFRLIDVASHTLPELQSEVRECLDALERLRVDSGDVFARHRLVQFSDSLHRIRVPRVEQDLETFEKATRLPAHGEAVRRLLAGYGTVSSAFLARVAVLPSRNASAVQLEALLKAGREAESSGFVLWSGLMKILEELLDQRSAGLYWRKWLFLTLKALTTALAMVGLLLVSRGVSRTLRSLSAIASAIARGDLAEAHRLLAIERVPEVDAGKVRDELMQIRTAMRDMNDNLQLLLGQVLSAKNIVKEQANQVAGSVQQLQAMVNQQSASASQMNSTSASIEHTVKQLADSVDTLSGRAARTADSATDGLSMLTQVDSTVMRLEEAGGHLKQTLEAIRERAARIDTILSAITRVANRSNLLSLNASIEASKAGAAASGFTVIALQIRQLADQTAASALDIERIIAEMHAAVHDGSTAFDEYLERTRDTSQFLAGVSARMSGILGDASVVAGSVQSVNDAIHAQSGSADEIGEAARQLVTASHHTRDSLVALNQAAQSLPQAVNSLEDHLSRFRSGA